MSSIWRQLRWRIIAANMLVVLVGVAAVLIFAFVAMHYIVPKSIEEGLSEIVAATVVGGEPQEITEASENLLNVFRQSIGTSVVIAAAISIIAGVIASLLLVREILRPLRQIAESSRRIASGHYDERVPIPSSDELAQMATNFNDMAEALARVEETRVTLIGDVSHELRTPLTSLSGYLEGMIDGLFPTNEETVALMNHEVRRMSRLVNDLQTLSRVEAGQFSLHMVELDISHAVEQVALQLQPQWQAQLIELTLYLPPNPVFINADNDRLVQILVNLLGNAIGYTPEGGAIDITVIEDGRSANFMIKDSGIGFTKEQQSYLFERFYRADQSRSRSSGGSGIGLTISRHLAWAMGGELTASSDGLGKGSTFFLSFPLVQ